MKGSLKTMRRLVSISFIILIAVILTACGGDGGGGGGGEPPSNTPPTPSITSPSDGSTYTKGDTITFSGTGEDPEDGALTGDSLVWTSSMHGQIGTGTSFTRDDLAAGTHTITLTATDSEDATGSDSVSIKVEMPSISIMSFDKTSVDPFSSLTISGTGFAPDNSAISVLIIPDGDRVPIAVPVISATSESLEIIVPPVVDETSDSFLSGTVNIQVIQIADDLVMTSNVLSGPSVEELPTVDAWLPSGEITRAYIESALNVLQSVKTRASTSSDLQKLIFPINALSSELEDLQSQIQQIVDNPTQSVTLTTTDGQTLTLNSATLVVLDRLVAGFVTQLVEQIPSDLTGTAKLEVTNIIMKRAASSCPTSTYDSPFIDEFICERQQYGENLYRAGQQAVKTGAKLEIGASLSVLGGFAGVVASAAEVSSLAFQSLWTAASGYITAYATSDPVPTPYKTLSDV